MAGSVHIFVAAAPIALAMAEHCQLGCSATNDARRMAGGPVGVDSVITIPVDVAAVVVCICAVVSCIVPVLAVFLLSSPPFTSTYPPAPSPIAAAIAKPTARNFGIRPEDPDLRPAGAAPPPPVDGAGAAGSTMDGDSASVTGETATDAGTGGEVVGGGVTGSAVDGSSPGSGSATGAGITAAWLGAA